MIRSLPFCAGAVAAGLLACSPAEWRSSPYPPEGAEGDGGGDGGAPLPADGGCVPHLLATVRDFSVQHPDFEPPRGGSKKGIVQRLLGADGKPTYGPPDPAPPVVTTSAENFDQWYRDVPGVNRTFIRHLPLERADGGSFTFESAAFFPVDGEGFGNEGREHNYYFTTEVHARFRYAGGEVFSFRGDDDIWVFVNGRLAMDLGGVHAALSGTVRFDAQAAELGLEVGREYPLEVFHAERAYRESNFRLETTIECLVPVLN